MQQEMIQSVSTLFEVNMQQTTQKKTKYEKNYMHIIVEKQTHQLTQVKNKKYQRCSNFN